MVLTFEVSYVAWWDEFTFDFNIFLPCSVGFACITLTTHLTLLTDKRINTEPICIFERYEN